MKAKIFAVFASFLFYSGVVRADLNNGLVAYYPFNGNANDESGNGSNGMVYGATLTTDRFGKTNSAYSFNGHEQYVDISNINISQSITYSAWVKKYDKHIIVFDGSYLLTIDQSQKIIMGGTKAGGSCLSDWKVFTIKKNNLYNGNWHHIAFTRNEVNGETVLYYDNVREYSHSYPGIISTCNYGGYVGAARSYTGEFDPIRYGIGDIDDIRIYDRALSASEIQEIYKEGTNKSLTISSFNTTPKAGNPPLTVNFNVTTKNSNGSIASYQWDFGDGNIDTTTTGKTSHTYNDLGIFNASVTILDNKGAKVKSNLVPITVQYGPDLVGKVESYTFTDSTNTIHIDFNVTNVGDVPVRQFPVNFNLSVNGKTVASTFKSLSVDKLAVGESQMLSVDYTFNESIYGKYVMILVDSTKSAAEVDETNNGTRIVIQPMATK